MKPVNCVRKVAAGLQCGLFLRKDFTLTAVGQDAAGNSLNSTTPVTGPPAFSGKPTGTFKEIACGSAFCLAISKSDGSISQWGCTEYGEPAAPPSGAFLKVAAAEYTAMALKSDGSVHVWRPSIVTPNSQQTGVPGSGVFTDIACGTDHCLAIKNDGTITAWGENASGQCDVPALSGGETWIAIAAGNTFSVGLKKNGSVVTLVAWGTYLGAIPSTPTLPVYWTKIAARQKNAMALKSDGTAEGWGDNPVWFVDRTGGDTQQDTIPTGKNHDIKDIAVGWSYSVILTHLGSALSWGENIWSCLTSWHNKCFKAATAIVVSAAPYGGATYLLKTDGTIVAASAAEGMLPDPLPRVYGKWAKISGGAEHLLALNSTGICVGYGNNIYGQCDVPGYSFIEIEAGNGTSFGIKTDGTIVGWGADDDDYITHIPAGTFTKISANCQRTAVGIKTDGSLSVWHGGDLDSENEFGPDTPAGNDFVDVKAGFSNHAIALRSDGSVACWGVKSMQSDTFTDPPPVNTGIIEIAAGFYFNAVLYNNGTVYVWGQTPYGQADVPSPNEHFIHIASRGNVVIGIKGIKDLFQAVAWGTNSKNECYLGLE